MHIRILTAVDGHPCGVVVEVDDAAAQLWIARHEAEPVRAAARQPQVEQATAEPVAEQAVSRRQGGRRGGGRRG